MNPLLTLTSAFLTGHESSQNEMETHPLIGHPVHKMAIAPLLSLKKRAADDGFDLRLTSGYRDFQRQLRIWNDKVLGLCPVMDNEGNSPLDVSQLTADELVMAILRWSAFPGASRHHWGSDIDVYDGRALEEKRKTDAASAEYKVQLTPEEAGPDGLFGEFHLWLDEAIGANKSEGFYRPYGKDRGGVSPERWHLSFEPLSLLCERAFTFEVFSAHLSNLSSQQLQLKNIVAERALEIYQRFITNTDGSPFAIP